MVSIRLIMVDQSLSNSLVLKVMAAQFDLKICITLDSQFCIECNKNIMHTGAK